MQTFNLIATMSAFENVELPMTILGKLSASQRKARAVDLLTKVSIRENVFSFRIRQRQLLHNFFDMTSKIELFSDVA